MLRITCGDELGIKCSSHFFSFTRIFEKKIKIEGNKLFHSWVDELGNNFYLFGNVVGVRDRSGLLSSPSLIKLNTKVLEDQNQISKVEGRFVVVKINFSGELEVWADQYGRVDIYCQQINGVAIFATRMDMLPISLSGSVLDEVGMAHSLLVYGSRPAKQSTLYGNVIRLGINQSWFFQNGNLKILKRKFIPRSTEPTYQYKDLNKYADFFIEAIRARSSSDGNIVYLSSGWDSTSILATLVHLHGNRKVRAIIGRMRYSDKSGVINQFEIDRAKAFANYFSIDLKVVEFDYRKDMENPIDIMRPFMQSHQLGSLVSVNHWKLAEAAAKIANGDESIFAGEISDGAHNLGFSQYTTIFHPASRDFREYSDKMASYLFGPTFYQQILAGTYQNDPVWQFFKGQNKLIKFDEVASGKDEISKQLLSSFFLRGGRIPFYSMDNSRLLTKNGREDFTSISEQTYFNDILDDITPENLYAYYLHFYNSFHWQGSTVASLELTAESHGLQCHMPFYDGQIIDFLSGMPENWGRGLDLKNTKYPLKWMLKNRIDYPYDLQSGPHAYTYDIKPEFSLTGEILHSSLFAPLLKAKLSDKTLIGRLNDNYFDHSYISDGVKKYIKGEEIRGQQMTDVMSLATHSLVGVF
jgi:hypothetical protein